MIEAPTILNIEFVLRTNSRGIVIRKINRYSRNDIVDQRFNHFGYGSFAIIISFFLLEISLVKISVLITNEMIYIANTDQYNSFLVTFSCILSVSTVVVFMVVSVVRKIVLL